MPDGHEEASTHRRATRPVRPPEFLPADALELDEPTRLAHGRTRGPLPGYDAPYTQQSAHQRSEPLAPIPRPAKTESRSESNVAPLPAPPKARTSSTNSAPRASTPPPAAATPPPGMPGMIDPMMIVVPPEIGAPIYSWVRRLALQADLPTADRVLRDALLELTSSLSVSIVYPGQDGLWTLGGDDEIPRDATPLVAVAQARRALIASHTALIPVVTTSEVVAVIVLTRNPRNPAYLPVEQIAMIGLARESASILHHLAVQHLQRAQELKADKGSLYRPEALHAHRTKGQEGALINLSPSWVTRAYPMLILTVLVGLVFAVFITVPTYSSGTGVIVLDGTPVSSPAVGTVDQVLVTPGQAVKLGTPLLRLLAAAETDELVMAKSDLDNATRAWIADGDDNSKKQLASAYSRFVAAKSKLDQRTIKAPKDGVVADLRIHQGSLLQPGDLVTTIVQAGKTEPEVWAFLPAKDRPRVQPGMTLQVELVGYTKSREKAIITYVHTETVSAPEAAKYIGASLADALKLPQGGTYMIVKARLPSRTFKTEHKTFPYHHGMQAVTEVKIASKPFLVDLLPVLEKYLPD